MTNEHSDDLERLVAEVLGGTKYRAVDPGLVRAIGAAELRNRGRLKEAVKETKSRLHQIAASYVDGRMDYADWLADLRRAAAAGDAQLRDACALVMRHHASTRERLPILDRFYAEALAPIPPPASVLDLACGLNPLALPWMPLAPGASYHACDIFGDMVAFVGEFLTAVGRPGGASVCDLLAGPPPVRADLVLALKALPVLEQVERGAGRALLAAIDAPAILVSFPARSLGGRAKGMPEHYERTFAAAVEGMPWSVQRFSYASELAFLIRK